MQATKLTTDLDIQSKIIFGVTIGVMILCGIFGTYRFLVGEQEKALQLLITFLSSSIVAALIVKDHQSLARYFFIAQTFFLAISTHYKFGFEQVYWQFPTLVALSLVLRGYKEVIALGGTLVLITAVILASKGSTNQLVTLIGSQIALLLLCGIAVELMLNKITETEHEADTDSLTLLKNRKSMDKYLDMHADGNSVLMLIDIDFFKRINDVYGHVVGDRVLKRIARTIENSTRNKDFSFRYGGEEFAIILPNTRLLDARVIAERIRLNVSSLVITIDTNTAISCTVSIGIAPILQNTTQSCLRECDRHLYEAKASGRNCVRYSYADIFPEKALSN